MWLQTHRQCLSFPSDSAVTCKCDEAGFNFSDHSYRDRCKHPFGACDLGADVSAVFKTRSDHYHGDVRADTCACRKTSFHGMGAWRFSHRVQAGLVSGGPRGWTSSVRVIPREICRIPKPSSARRDFGRAACNQSRAGEIKKNRRVLPIMLDKSSRRQAVLDAFVSGCEDLGTRIHKTGSPCSKLFRPEHIIPVFKLIIADWGSCKVKQEV